MSGSKVLVIDDSSIVLDFVRDALEPHGLTVVTVNTPIGASLVISDEQPDLVLVDVKMASLTGDRLAASLRRNRRLAGLRVYLYSVLPAQQLQRLAEECGADGFLCKGEDDVSFAQTIHKCLKSAPSGDDGAD